MDLESRNVFIDTQSFIKMGLNFDHITLHQLVAATKNGKLRHYMTSVVENEVRAHINKSISDAILALKQFQRKARMLEKLEDPELKNLFHSVDETSINEKAQNVFSQFLKDAKSEVVTADKISVENILHAYFTKRPPFSEKKKSEFPDAISLASLSSVLEGARIYVVSEDPDHAAFCDANDQFVKVDSLDKFLDIFNRHENALSGLVLAQVASEESQILEEIKSAIGELDVYNSAPWEDSEIDNFEVLSIENMEPSVIYIDDEASIVTLEFDVTFSASATGPDFLNGRYDSEDKCIYAYDKTTNTSVETRNFSAEIAYSYSVKNGKLEEITRKNAQLLNTTDIAVYVNEYDEYWD